MGNFNLGVMLMNIVAAFFIRLKSAFLTGMFSMCFFSGIGFWIYAFGYIKYNWSAYAIGSVCLSTAMAGGTEVKYPNFWDFNHVPVGEQKESSIEILLDSGTESFPTLLG